MKNQKRSTVVIFCVLVLLSSTSLFSQTPNDDLIKVSLAGDVSAVKKLVESGADVNYKNAQAQTPLSVAFWHKDVIEYLLSKGADVNGGDSPALVSAARFYAVDEMKTLLKAGADPNKPAVVKVDMAAGVRKALEDEKAKGKKANKYMVKAYEDQLSKMPAGNTITTYPLAAAIEGTNCLECMQLLLNAGAKTDIGNAIIGGNLIHDATFSYKSEEERNQNIQANVPYFDKAGMGTPEWYKTLNVSSYGSIDDIIALLKSKNIDMEGLDNNKRTPLKIAVTVPTPSEDLVNALVNNGASLKAVGMTLTESEFEAETKDPEKIKVRYDFPREGRNAKNGAGYSANMDLVNPKPTRVALISYYLYDAGKGKANALGVGAWRTQDGAGQTQVDGFYRKSIGKLKDTFKENGITLLTPAEFLDTQEKAETYYGFEQESAKKEKTTISRSRTTSSSFTAGGWTTTTYTTRTATASTLKVCPSGAGYRAFFVANEAENESQINNFQGGIFSANRKLTSNLGNELCKELGVDAVLVVYIATRKPKQNQDDYGVNAVVSIMLGPNPSRSEASDADAKNLGQFYCGTRTFFSSPLIFKDNKAVFGQYDGMANILAAHAKKMSTYINGKEKDSD
jgi:ankyrin repeat protein